MSVKNAAQEEISHEPAPRNFWSIITPLIARATHSTFWRLCLDIYPALAAAALPWSTSTVLILMAIWLGILIPTIGVSSFLRSLTGAAFWLPLALIALAIVGTLWAQSAWPLRLHGISAVLKLLALPFLLYHFERSNRGLWVLVAFLTSCAILMILSWAVFIAPQLVIGGSGERGVPIRNSIDQSQEFALCIFILAPVVASSILQRRFWLAAALTALVIGFIGNMMYVVLSRTSLLYMLILSVLFAVRRFDGRLALRVVAGAMATVVLIWCTSPYLRYRVEQLAAEYQAYRENNAMNSTGRRIEYLDKSIGFIREAPLLGHGTGENTALFEAAAVGKTGAAGDRISNPHNQTLYVAIEWGAVGCVLLYAMWYFHLALFLRRDLAAWIGMTVVVQNFVSSLSNSHLFDFTEGWIYVLGVGVAGGITTSIKRTGATEANKVTAAT
jgi:hypothetical protein